MRSFKIFLTKSHAAAQAIYNGLPTGIKKGFGCADDKIEIPAIYHGLGFFFAYTELPTEGNKPATYELIIC